MSASYYYLNHPHLNLDTSRPAWDDDVSSILDDNILENTIDSALELTPVEQRRRESLMEAASYSPSRDWTDDFDMGSSLDGPSPVTSASFEHSHGTNNPFIKLEATQPFSPQNNGWNSRAMTSGSVTPATYDAPFGAAHFDTSYLSSYATPAPASYELTAAAHITPNSIYQTPASSTVPVASSNQWPPTAIASAAPAPSQPATNATPTATAATATSTTNDQESRPITKRMRPQSPAPRSHSPINLRRDGIRKKNARFDIPAERTLLNIDTLIAQSADDQEIKELKQQKRLLRNRQAALDSRQRKKQHTERLEEEKKLHSSIISDLEEKLAVLTMRDEEWRKRFEEVSQERDFARHQLKVAQMEKEEMVKAHTIESGELRKKNNYLENQLQKMETLIEQHNISSSGAAGGAYTDDFAFEDMEMNNFWTGNSFPTADPFDMPPDIKTAVVKKSEAAKSQEQADEKPAAPGLLLILLLCGAFVASSSQAATTLPPLPQPIRTASAGILQNIFQDAGVTSSQGRVQDLEATMTDSWTDSKSSTPQMVGLESSVAMLNAQLAGSSLEQDPQQFMQLSPAEYNDVTSKEFLREPEPSTRGRRSLEQGLASLRSQSKPSAAEVYTRSLLWDKVDAEVVRRFAAFAQRAAARQTAAGDGDDMMSV